MNEARTAAYSRNSSQLLERAIDTIANRLADPHAMRPQPAGDNRRALSERLSLASGEAGVALLFAELGHTDHIYRQIAHRYLALANEALRMDHKPGGLYFGPTALAFATQAATRRTGDYATLLAGLDRSVYHSVTSLINNEQARRHAARPAMTVGVYDIITGLSGLGRYLLARHHTDPHATSILRQTLESLVALIEPVTLDGIRYPGWWTTEKRPYGHRETYTNGHANLGLAHGIPGPLALLALSRSAGFYVANHDRAIEVMVEFLQTWSDRDEAGPYWPALLSPTEYPQRPTRLPPTRAAWCYGTPGIARAIQLAGQALGRTDWRLFARQAIQAVFARPEASWMIQDSGLCHGWAGLLHVTARIATDDSDSGLEQYLPSLAWKVAAHCHTAPRDSYGKTANADLTKHGPPAPGFLTGAAGSALALLAYRSAQLPRCGWDAALLIA